ncbi:hypothetical protein K8I28_01125 [bacterium]|nr:hypothetical protein [bacterium]
MKKYLFLILAVVLVIPIIGQAQEYNEEGFLVIEADPELPLALVTLTRTRPEFTSTGLIKDISAIPVTYKREVFAPADVTLQPKKIPNLKSFLEKERE